MDVRGPKDKEDLSGECMWGICDRSHGKLHGEKIMEFTNSYSARREREMAGYDEYVDRIRVAVEKLRRVILNETL